MLRMFILIFILFISTVNAKDFISIKKIKTTIKIDGEMTESVWQDLEPITNFKEFEPKENAEPDVMTKAYLFYDEKNLYVGIKAYDNPKEVRYSLTSRDNIYDDDFAGIILDTYGNASWSYQLLCNPIGIQGDAKRTPDREDDSFDVFYYSAGTVTDSGYIVEMKIPFKSLSFPAEKIQNWRIIFGRIRPRDSKYIYFCPPISRQKPCLECQALIIKGLHDIYPGKNIRLIPAITGNKVYFIKDYDNPDMGMDSKPVEGKVSLTGRFNINSNLSTEFTVNPDFSQVESDPAQIDVNSTFALFYSEKRPFFQEGMEIFNSFFNLVYTRSINNPIGAVKLISRFGKWDVAYLGAKDKNTPIIIPLEESSEFVGNGKSYSNILRIKRNIGNSSYYGFLFSNRAYEKNAYNNVFSFDFKYLFLQNYTVDFQIFKTFTHELIDSSTIEDFQSEVFGYNNHTVALDGEKYSGYGLISQFDYSSRHLYSMLRYKVVSPEVRVDNGFITQTNYEKLLYLVQYNYYPEWKFVDLIQPRIMASYIQNTKKLRKDKWIYATISFQMKRQTYFRLSYVISQERFRGKDFPGIKRISLFCSSRINDVFEIGMRSEIGKSIARTLDEPVLGNVHELELFSDLKIHNRLFIEPSFNYYNLKYPDSDENIYDGYIYRIKTTYQLKRELFVRLVLQYDNFSSDFNIEPLISYQINPFTLVYIGASTSHHDYGEQFGFRTVGKQFFFKLQYLWQS